MNKYQQYQFLILACEKGDLKSVKYWIDFGLDPKHNHNTPIRCAAKCGHLKIVEYLVKKGASDKLALFYASQAGHIDIIKYLVSIGTDVQDEDDQLIGIASSMGHFDTVKYLVSIGAGAFHGIRYPFGGSEPGKLAEVNDYLVNIILTEAKKTTLLMLLNRKFDKKVIHKDMLCKVDKHKYREEYTFCREMLANFC